MAPGWTATCPACKRGESLGADIARQHGFGPQLHDRLGGLDSSTLGRVEVLHVVMCSELAGVGVDQQEIPGTPEPRVDRLSRSGP